MLMGCGFGLIMPTIIATVVEGVDPEHAGLAAGVVMSGFQVGAAVGVAVVGRTFFGSLGTSADQAAYRHAFALSTFVNAALLAVATVFAFALARAQHRKSRRREA